MDSWCICSFLVHLCIVFYNLYSYVGFYFRYLFDILFSQITILLELWRSFPVLVAELVKHYHPHLVEIHNYTSAHAISRKAVNWKILNR